MTFLYQFFNEMLQTDLVFCSVLFLFKQFFIGENSVYLESAFSIFHSLISILELKHLHRICYEDVNNYVSYFGINIIHVLKVTFQFYHIKPIEVCRRHRDIAHFPFNFWKCPFPMNCYFLTRNNFRDQIFSKHLRVLISMGIESTIILCYKETHLSKVLFDMVVQYADETYSVSL